MAPHGRRARGRERGPVPVAWSVMSPQGSPQGPPPPPPPPRDQRGPGIGRRPEQGWPRWGLWVIGGVILDGAAAALPLLERLGGEDLLLRVPRPGRRRRRQEHRDRQQRRLDHGRARERRDVHHDRPARGRHPRERRGAARRARRRGRSTRPRSRAVPQPAAVPAPHRAHRRAVRVDATAAAGPDGRDHVHRPVEGEDVLDRAARARPSPTSPATRA